VKWVLDDGPFSHLTKELAPGDLEKWPDSALFIAAATAAGALNDRSGREQAALAVKSRATGASVITVFDVLLPSRAGSILYEHLRKGISESANLAEHQSIAWMLTERVGDLVFVAEDKHAAFLALAELGRCRVCHLFELWDHFRSEGLLNDSQYQGLMNRTLNRAKGGMKGLPGIPWRFRS
jgi:hypothetical protein